MLERNHLRSLARGPLAGLVVSGGLLWLQGGPRIFDSPDGPSRALNVFALLASGAALGLWSWRLTGATVASACAVALFCAQPAAVASLALGDSGGSRGAALALALLAAGVRRLPLRTDRGPLVGRRESFALGLTAAASTLHPAGWLVATFVLCGDLIFTAPDPGRSSRRLLSGALMHLGATAVGYALASAIGRRTGFGEFVDVYPFAMAPLVGLVGAAMIWRCAGLIVAALVPSLPDPHPIPDVPALRDTVRAVRPTRARTESVATSQLLGLHSEVAEALRAGVAEVLDRVRVTLADAVTPGREPSAAALWNRLLEDGRAPAGDGRRAALATLASNVLPKICTGRARVVVRGGLPAAAIAAIAATSNEVTVLESGSVAVHRTTGDLKPLRNVRVVELTGSAAGAPTPCDAYLAFEGVSGLMASELADLLAGAARSLAPNGLIAIGFDDLDSPVTVTRVGAPAGRLGLAALCGGALRALASAAGLVESERIADAGTGRTILVFRRISS